MQKHHFLFLTNTVTEESYLAKLKEDLNESFDFIIHSPVMEDKNHGDLRNYKKISGLTRDNTIVIFCLTEDLSLFVINQFTMHDKQSDRNIIFISSLTTNFLPPKRKNFITNSICRKLLQTKYSNSHFIFYFFSENEYEGYPNQFSYLKLFVIPTEIVLKEIIIRITDNNFFGKEYVFIPCSFLNQTIDDKNGVKKIIYKKLINPTIYLSGKKRRDYLHSFLKILKTDKNFKNLVPISFNKNHKINDIKLNNNKKGVVL